MRLYVTVTLVVVVSVLAFGCGKRPDPLVSSELSVTPGLGIPTVCEVGMTVSQIREHTDGASVHGIYEGALRRLWEGPKMRFVLVPSLGLVAPFVGSRPIANLAFHVQRTSEGLIPGLEVKEPFRGKVGGISFSSGAPVTREQVEKEFGAVTLVATNAALGAEFRKAGVTFCEVFRNTTELWYPGRGISFVLASNIVVSFDIYAPNVRDTAAGVGGKGVGR